MEDPKKQTINQWGLKEEHPMVDDGEVEKAYQQLQ